MNTFAKTSCLTLLACLFAGRILAATFNPFEDSKITVEQWQEYFDTVQYELGHTRKELSAALLILFEDASSSTNYAFTLPEHPAHPAWVTRRLVEENGEVTVDLIGYFAGDEVPFSELFQDYAELTYQIQSELEAQKETEE